MLVTVQYILYAFIALVYGRVSGIALKKPFEMLTSLPGMPESRVQLCSLPQIPGDAGLVKEQVLQFSEVLANYLGGVNLVLTDFPTGFGLGLPRRLLALGESSNRWGNLSSPPPLIFKYVKFTSKTSMFISPSRVT